MTPTQKTRTNRSTRNPGALATAHAEAHHRLAGVLLDLVDAGDSVPCAGLDAFTSDDPDERALAATICPGCPAFAACHDAGQHERFGIWAGTDRTKTAKGVTP